MVVLEGAINNIMGGMENTAGVRLHSHRHKLKQRFDIVKKLGQGTYGKVQLAINKETGQEVAIKTIKKAKIETEQDLVRIRREIQIMSSVQHPQIIHIYEVFENREKMVLVMEYAAGGELYDYLSERKVLPEPEARRVFRQVASAVYYCHKHKICHRDLKLENILLDLDGNAKIADFGLSNVFAEKQRLDTFCGSPLYASPEIVKGIPYVGPEVDCWSLGVLLYTLVYGAMPFDGSNFRRLVKQITQGDFYEPSSPATASELIRHMLTVDSVDRASIEDICNHWWVNEGYADSCLVEAEALASLTPVRLDLLLSLAPKQISSEHMLIQPDEEDVSQKSESERDPPNLKLPPPPNVPPEEETTNGVTPMRSHSLGAVPPPGTLNVDLLVERKRKEKKDPSTKKGPGKPPPAGEEEKKRVERGKKREASSDREKKKSGAKRRESSLTRKPSSASTEGEAVEKKPLSELASPREHEVSNEAKTIPKETPTIDKGPPSPDLPPNKAEAIEDTPVEDKDTEAILKETAAKIEAVEDLMKAEGEEEKKLPSTPATSPQATPSVVSVASSQAASPTRSRAESESSTDAVRTPRSESSSRRQSKIFSKAALFDPALAAQTSKSPPSSADRGPSKRVTRLGALNMTDLAKKFEEKPSPGSDKKGKVAVPFKVSDAKKAFESSSDGKAVSESPKRKASVGSSSGDSGITTPRESTVTASLTAKDEVPASAPPSSPVKGAAGKTSREASPLKVLKSSSKDSAAPAKKKERSPPAVAAPPSQIKSPKKEDSPVKQTLKTASVAKEDKPPPSVNKTTKMEPKSSVLSSSKDAVPSGRRPKETSEITAQKDSAGRDLDAPLDSSDSESEAEKILRELSVKREKVEMAKKEKLKKVTEGKDISPVSTEEDIQSGIKLPSSSASSASSTQDVNDHKYATLPRGFRAKPEQPKVNKPKIPTPKMNSFDESTASSDNLRKKSQMEIVLNNRQTPSKRSSFAEIHISPAPPKGEEKSKAEFRTEVQHNVTPAPGGALPEPHLQRARRERIIPIMLEDDLSNGGVSNDSRRPPPPTKAPSLSSSVSSLPRNSGGFGAVPVPTTVTALSAAEQKKNQTTASPEPIRKSRRERIIPIAVEGEGFVTPPVSETTNADKVRPPFQRQGSSQGSYSRGRAFTVDRTESFSSAGEDDDDEDDGFQILTAESLFSTLLARVRSLTRKMATDEGGRSGGPGGGERIRRLPHSSANSSSQSAGFWSSLYSPPREIPGSRRVSETSSRRHSRDDDPFEGFGPPLWGRSASRDASESESVFSEPSTFSTLPRGWRTRRSGREESVVEGDESLASFTPSRRQFYSRTHSRDNPSLNTDGEDTKIFANRNSWDASSSTGTLPRSDQAVGPALPTTKFSQKPTSGVASLYENFSQNRFVPSSGTSDSTELRNRPLSSSSSGEAKGRVGGHCEQQSSNNAAHLVSSNTKKNEDLPRKNKQSMQQLQDLVNELESIPDDGVSDLSEKPKVKVELRMTPPIGGGKGSITRVGLTSPNPSKSLSSFQKQREVNDASSSNPNIVYNVTLSHLKEKDGQNPLVSTSKSQSNLKNNNEKMNQLSSSMKNTLTGSLKGDTDRVQNEPMVKNKYKDYSDDKMPQNTFIPYDPNLNPSTSLNKNLYADKRIGIAKDKSPIPNSDIEIKKDNISSSSTHLASNSLIRNGKSEKGIESPGSKMGLQNDTSKHPWKLKQSFSDSNDENKKLSSTRDPKTSVVTDLYKKGRRSEDLNTVIELVNAPDSCNKEGIGKGTLKGYRRTKSREVTPAIEAVSEKIAQFNSSTLKRISPFEAYRRSKSKELGSAIESVNSGSVDGPMKSPPPSEIVPKSSDAGMSQFEKAKNSIEKKFEKARSPLLENELAKPIHNDSMKESLKLPLSSASVTDIPKEREKASAKEKTPVKENEKTKSMYKILTSKFTRSLSNVGEEKYNPSKSTAKDTEDDLKEREDKVWQKKPSKFLKSKMEKSASRTSFYDMDDTKEEDEEDKSEKKSTKFSNALNKFLGRKHTTEDSGTKKVPPTKSTSAAIITEKSRRPPRFSSQNISKSQENLNQKEANEGMNTTHDTIKRKLDEVSNESATEDICKHLSQMELNITSRIGDLSPYALTPPPQTETIPTMNTTSSVPSSESGDGGMRFTTNKGGRWSQHQSPTKSTQGLLSDQDLLTQKRLTGEFSEDGSITPTTESGNESIQSPSEDFKEMEDESVMDRITRKSYYTRFNEMKRKPKPKRIDTKEAMDQQLAEAKARLLHEELQPKRRSIIRDSMSPISVTPKATSPSFATEGIVRKNSKPNLHSQLNSLSPEEGTNYYTAGVRRAVGGHSPRLDESLNSFRYYSSDDKDDTSTLYRSMSEGNHEGKIPYRKHTSTLSSTANDLTNYQRPSTRTRDDPSFHLRQPSIPREELSPFRHPPSRRSSIAKDESQSFRRLSSSNLDDSNLGLQRLSSVPRDDFGYKSPSTSHENNSGYHTLQYRKPPKEHSSFRGYNSANHNNSKDSLPLSPTRSERNIDSKRKSPSVAPSITLNQRNLNNPGLLGREDTYGKSEIWGTVASAAGKAAGEAAAAVAPSISSDASRPSVPKSASESAAVKSAREELSRRLTPLTRLSNMGHSGNNESSYKTRPYRKNATSDGLPFKQCDPESTSTGERPPYKRTNTIDLPPTDSRIRTTDYRKVLQDPARKFTGISKDWWLGSL